MAHLRSVISKRTCLLFSIMSLIGVLFHIITDAYLNPAPPTLKTSGYSSRRSYRLIDPPVISKKTDEPMSENKAVHSILWYHPPHYYHEEIVNNGLSKCAYNNCVMTDEVGDIKSYSAIIFTLDIVQNYAPPLTWKERPREQVWVYFVHESPLNTGLVPDNWKSTINWTMTYRSDSDVVRPYGFLTTRSYPDRKNYSQIFERKSKFAAWFVGHCDAESGRDIYVNELRRQGIPVDIYGKCGDLGTPSRLEQIQILNRDYKFNLAFENSLCPDYISEKLFDNYNLDVVLVVRGGANYSRLLPNGVFIDTFEFTSPRSLAKYLMAVNSSKSLYADYLRKKNRYESHGHPSSSKYSNCQICKKLNNIEKNRNVYQDINKYLFEENYSCKAPKDITYYPIYYYYYITFIVSLCVVALLAKTFTKADTSSTMHSF